MRGQGQGLRRRAIIASFIASGLLTAVSTPAAPAAVSIAPNVPISTAASSRQVLVMLRLWPRHSWPDARYSPPHDDSLNHAALRRHAGKIARIYDLKVIGDWPMPLIGLDCFKMVEVGSRSQGALVTLLNRDPSIAWSEPVATFAAEGAVSRN